ncbi:MAG: NfeD family protein [Desulfonatronovibrio sp.]
MREPIIYTLLQIPGFLFIGIILVSAWERGWLSGRTAFLIIMIWVIKDVFLYGFYKNALKASPQDVISRLHGSVAVALERLDPTGQVKLRGEIWQAVNIGKKTIEPVQQVKVKGNRGLTLEVELEEN